MRLPTAEEVDAIVAENMRRNATIACPACAAAPGVECPTSCHLYNLSRELEACDECDGDIRLCLCALRYAP